MAIQGGCDVKFRAIKIRAIGWVCGVLMVTLTMAGMVAAADEGSTAKAEPTKNTEDGAAPESYLLRYRYEAGETLRWDVSDVWSREVVKGGVMHRDEASSLSEKVWKFTEVTPEGNGTFENSLAWIDMRRQAGGEPEVRYDSRKDKELPPEFRVTPETESVVGKIFADITIDPRGETVKRIQRESTAVQSGSLLPPLPEEPVRIGEPWFLSVDTEVPIPDSNLTRKIKARQRFVLEKVEGDVATVRMTTQILTPITDPQVAAQTLQLEKKIVLRFDLKRGKLLRLEQTANRHIVGFSGNASVLKYRLSHTETLL